MAVKHAELPVAFIGLIGYSIVVSPGVYLSFINLELVVFICNVTGTQDQLKVISSEEAGVEVIPTDSFIVLAVGARAPVNRFYQISS